MLPAVVFNGRQHVAKVRLGHARSDGAVLLGGVTASRGDYRLQRLEKGVDVTKVLQAFRLAVNDISRWEVLEQVWLGIFSFTKYLMWKDLQDRTHQLVQSRVVQHLLEQPGAELNEEVRDDWEAKPK